MKQPKTSSALNIWLADLTYTQQAISGELIPQAIGRIATYTEKQFEHAFEIRLFKYPEVLCKALVSERCPEILGLSHYIWNSKLASAIAETVKKHSAGTIVVLGGPNFPITEEDRGQFLRDNPQIDFYISHEGEHVFYQLVHMLFENDFDKEQVHGTLNSVHSIDKKGRIHVTKHAARIQHLEDIPSPYTTGKLDPFFDGKLLPIIQTVRGCPFTCTYCVEGTKFYSPITRLPEAVVSEEINYIGRIMAELRKKGGRNDLFIADSNFGMFPENLSTFELIASAQEKYGWPDYINVATGKENKDIIVEGVRIIKGALRVSGSVQSLDSQVLKNIRRHNISTKKLMKMAQETAVSDANSYSDVILALPGDSYSSHMFTLRGVIEAGFNFITTHQLMLLPGSEMCTQATKKEYGMDLRYRVFPRCHGSYKVFGENLSTAEIEEICVASNTLSFDDYLECRKFHLLIQILYNDGFFKAVLKLLQHFDLSVFSWLEFIRDSQFPEGLKGLFDSFTKEMQNELWNSRQALENFISEDNVIERFNRGELGRNLLFTYKAIAITQYTDDLSKLVFESTLNFIEKDEALDEWTELFIKDAVTFHSCQVKGIFTTPEAGVSAELNFDIQKYIENKDYLDYRQLKFDKPREVDFILDTKQQISIKSYLDLFGAEDHSIGRIMTKVHLKKFFRQPVLK